MGTASINGNKATIYAYCALPNHPPKKNCTSADIPNFGGYIRWNVPAAKTLHASSIEVSVSGFTYAQLLKIARGLK
jgi:hypothetical protein